MGLRRSLCEVGIGAEAWSLRLGSWGWLGKPVPGRGNRTQEDTEARAVGRSEGKTGKSVVEAREKWVAELERGAGREPVGLSASAAAMSSSVLGPLTAPLPVSSSAPCPWTCGPVSSLRPAAPPLSGLHPGPPGCGRQTGSLSSADRQTSPLLKRR